MIRQKMIIKIVIIFFYIGFTMLISDAKYTKALANHYSSNLPFIGKITEVGNNYSMQVDNNTDVKLAFLNTHTKDPQILADATHFMSVLCPIRSPVLVYPDLSSVLLNNVNDTKSEISALVYCQNFDNQSNEDWISLNEELVKAKLAILIKMPVQCPSLLI